MIRVSAAQIGDKVGLTLTVHDGETLALIKSVEGAEYDYTLRCWTIPPAGLDYLEAALGRKLVLDSALQHDRPPTHAPITLIEDFRPHRETFTERFDPTNTRTATDFQYVGTSFLVQNSHAILADEQGLGKSKQLIDAVTYIGAVAPQIVLLLCKKSNIGTWMSEIKQFAAEPVYWIAEGTKQQREAVYENVPSMHDLTRAGFLLVSYETMRNDIDIIAQMQFDWIVADEAQKVNSSQLNGQSKVAEVIHRLWAPRMTVLTGSPMINAPLDAWNLLHWMELDPRPYEQFEEDTCEVVEVPNGRGPYSGTRRKVKRYKAEGLKALRDIFFTSLLRRTKEEVLPSLPEKQYRTIKVELSLDAQRRYTAAENDLILYARDADIPISRIPNDNVLKMRLRQITSEDHIPHVENIVRERAGKSIVFTQFRPQLAALAQALDDLEPAIIHGDTPHRENEVETFQTSDSCRVFLGSTYACREGLTLTAAENVIFLDCEWSPENQKQAEDRAHRIGQKSPVTIFKLISVQRKKSRKHGTPLLTIDSTIIATHAHKAKVMEQVL